MDIYSHCYTIVLGMKKIKAKHIELIYIVHAADSSFLKMNAVIRRYHLELHALQLDEFERLYGEAFNLGPLHERQQNLSITVSTYKNNEAITIYISTEFYQKIMYTYGAGCRFLETGYVVFLKAARTAFVEPTSSNLQMVLQLAEALHKKVNKLEHCLRLIRYGFFEFDTAFAYLVHEAKIISLRLNPSVTPTITTELAYQENDNHLLAILLRVEQVVAEYISNALQTFDLSLHIQNGKIRFLQLMLCLEMCLNNFFNEPTSHTIAQNTSILLSKDKNDIKKHYNEVIAFYDIKKNILNGKQLNPNHSSNASEALKRNITMLENMSRDILKKLIKLNIKDKEQFMYELSLKAMQIRHQL